MLIDPVCAYVYDLAGLRAHASAAVAALPEGCELFYALKANSEPRVIEALTGVVTGFEVGSAGEIDLVRAAAPEAPIIFGGPGKTDSALAAAARRGVVAVHVESVHELRRAEYVAAGLDVRLPVALRVNLAGPLPVATLAMAGRPTQFGIDEGDVPAALAEMQRCGHLEFVGFHFHCISNHHDAPAHARLVAGYLERAQEWADDAGVELHIVNAGGGIGVDYAALDRPFDWKGFCAALPDAAPVRLRFECGRYLAAAWGAYVTEVLDVKTNHGAAFAVVRGGTHHFRLPASWGHSHPFTVIPVEEWGYPFPRPAVRRCPVTVAGELCSPKDVLARDVPVEELRAGDLLWFHHAGAYGWSISHHDFLSHPHPRRVFLDGGGLEPDGDAAAALRIGHEPAGETGGWRVGQPVAEAAGLAADEQAGSTVVRDPEHLRQPRGRRTGVVEEPLGVADQPVGLVAVGRLGGEGGEASGGGRRNVAPQQAPSHPGDGGCPPDSGGVSRQRQREVVDRLDEGAQVTVEQPGPGPGEQRLVVVDEHHAGGGGRLVIAGQGREARRAQRNTGWTAVPVEGQHGVRGGEVGNPPGTDETGDGCSGDAHCPRLAEQ
jgi:diaminopimelate decarboxylase